MSEDSDGRKTGASTFVDKPDPANAATDDGDLASGVTGATKREGSARTSKSQEPNAKLTRGTLVGRYVVIDVLGEGGMGVVYAAYDPELDRKVAIKLLQGKPSGGSTSHGDQAWLQREAQALARLSHPNVIACHDVGTLPGDRVYVAMELVEGMTLRAWLKQPRTWREVREVMLAAGAGLAAAHRSGLIHRDFKPENVLVGNDGRVRVMDFGLARLQPSGDEAPAARTSDLQIEARSPLSESLTIAGSVVGTPAYMAPEIFEGVSASARSDQFAFGVTLYELLFLARPYDKRAFAPSDDRPPLADIKPRDPPKAGVPPRLQRVAMRAIAIDPDARFASMDALLAELAVDPMAARRRALFGLGGAAVVTTAVITTMQMSSSEPGGDRSMLCKGAERHLAGVWDPAIKKTIRAAFEATDRPFKAQAFAAIESTLDSYAAEWTSAVTDSCEATKLRGDQTEDVQSLRQDCFDQRLAVVRSLTGLLVKADDKLVEKASDAALALQKEESVRRCADISALKAPTQPNAEIRPQVMVAVGKLADARAAIMIGNWGRVINASREAVKLATAIPFDPVIAETQLMLGMAMMQLGAAADAMKALSEATWAGLRGKRDDVAGEAALYATQALTQLLSKPDDAKIWLQIAKASLARAGHPRRLETLVLEAEGMVFVGTSDLAAASESFRKAFVRAQELYGKDNPLISRSAQLLGASLGQRGDYAAALPYYLRALELSIKWLGPDHPDVAVMHSGLGGCYHHTGDIAKSRKHFMRAIEIRERVFGKDSPVLIPTLNNTSELLLTEGDIPGALAMSTRAKQLLDKTLGKGHPYYPSINSTYGTMLLAAGRLPEARVALDDAVAIAERTKSAYLGAVLAERARLARAEAAWDQSAKLDERSIAAIEAASGKTGINLWKPLTGLGLAKLHAKKPEEARVLLERALAIATTAKLPELELGELRGALARLPPPGPKHR